MELMMTLRMFSLVTLAFGLLHGSGSASLAQEETDTHTEKQPGGQVAFSKEQLEFFDKEVKPILQSRCFKCHGVQPKLAGELNLSSLAGVHKGGESGPAVDAKNPKESWILDAINYETYEMPPDGKLPAKQIATLTKWVHMGGPMPSEPLVSREEHHEEKGPPPVNAKTKSHWAFQSVKRPEVPVVKNAEWGKHPIDAFLLAQLEAKNLQPNAPADKTSLLRRVTYDLTGLPPTPEELQAFLKDDSDQAYEKVVDRLLASPHYGEKWARHWLDLVRYAETNSYERDSSKPFVWRYRDYVIRSFNDDKPYDQFLIEQLAGDELPNPQPDHIIATGYYRLGVWDDEPVSSRQAFYDDVDDILMTTSQVMLGLTVNCARCHDHKLDPIPQADYYRLLAFFRNYRRYGVRGENTVRDASLVNISLPGDAEREKKLVAEHLQKKTNVKRRISDLEKKVIPDFIPVEKEEFQFDRNREALMKKRIGKVITQREFDRYRNLRRELDKLNKVTPRALSQALAIKEHGRHAPETFVLIRGNPAAEGKLVRPGFPQVLDFPDPVIPEPLPDAKSTGRRMVLAKWMASEKNPLTARVMANRIWQHHFGRGIVTSTSDFGLQGTPPTHPQLLDWLAAEFVKLGWKMKPLHKQIVMSNGYRMSSDLNPTAYDKDPENRLFWRFNMRRLTAEEIRDSILAVNASLNKEKMFGPSIYPKLSREVLQSQSRPGAGWGNSSPEDRARRSIYIHIKRSLIVPMMESFDVADTDSTCPVRFATTQPTQALGFLNGEFINEQANVFAKHAQKAAGENREAQVKLILTRATQRTPNETEIQRGLKFLELCKTQHNLSDEKALTYFCLIALNLNEFMYLD